MSLSRLLPIFLTRLRACYRVMPCLVASSSPCSLRSRRTTTLTMRHRRPPSAALAFEVSEYIGTRRATQRSFSMGKQPISPPTPKPADPSNDPRHDPEPYQDPVKDPPFDPPDQRPLIDPQPPSTDVPRMQAAL